jgi:hypothetical protein
MPRPARSLRMFAVLLFAVAAAVPASVPATAAATCQSWGALPPDPGGEWAMPKDVVVLSPCAAWAVGTWRESGKEWTLIYRWNGTRWAMAASPNPSPDANTLSGVAAVSAKDVWAVGRYSAADDRPLALRWNGSAWSQVTTPRVGRAAFEDVAALGAGDVWAVGHRFENGRARTLIERWNGTRWKVVPSPNAGDGGNYLFAIDARAADDVWAVGRRQGEGGRSLNLTLHWNGTRWKVVKVPTPSTDASELHDVVAVSATKAWAVGAAFGGGVDAYVLRWNGTSWKVANHPPLGDDSNLNGLAATSATNVWAVGVTCDASDVCRSLVMRWGGTRWAIQPTPSAKDSYLSGIDASSSTNAWAVGFYRPASTNVPYAIHCC